MPTIQISGASLSYTHQGRGLPVVLLHGFPLDSRVWTGQIDALASVARVIALDMRGFGQSSTHGSFTIDTLADDLKVLQEKLSLGPIILAGLSMGGYVGQAFAGRYRRDLKALILIDTKSEADSPAGKDGRNKMIEIVRASGSGAVAEMMLPKMLGPETARLHPEIVDNLISIMQACPARTIEYACTALRDRDDYGAVLAKLTMPVQLIFGEHDQISPLEMARTMASRIRNARLDVIPNAGHMSPMEQPQLVSKVMKEFIDQVNTTTVS